MLYINTTNRGDSDLRWTGFYPGDEDNLEEIWFHHPTEGLKCLPYRGLYFNLDSNSFSRRFAAGTANQQSKYVCTFLPDSDEYPVSSIDYSGRITSNGMWPPSVPNDYQNNIGGSTDLDVSTGVLRMQYYIVGLGTKIPSTALTNGLTVFYKAKWDNYFTNWRGILCVSQNDWVRIERTDTGFALYDGQTQRATVEQTYDGVGIDKTYSFVYTIAPDGNGGVIYSLYDDGNLVARSTYTTFPRLDHVSINTKGGNNNRVGGMNMTNLYRMACWDRVLTEEEIKNLF